MSGTTTLPVVIGAFSTFSGALGGQSWGALKVSALGWNGAATLVTRTTDGLGVDGGRLTGQIDFNSSTKQSEMLRLDFAEAVGAATLRLARLSPSDGPGQAEVGAWRAFDAAGKVVGEGLLDPRGRTAVGTDSYDVTIDPALDFRRIELTARPLNNDATLGVTAANSDFAVAQVSYVPAPVAPPAVTVVGASAALTGGLGAQSWGGLKVSALSYSGSAALVGKSGDGLGVSGGRFAGQIDHDPATRSSETLRLDFGTAVDTATVRLGRLNANEDGRAEVGAWRALDGAGNLVGQGLLDPRGRTEVAGRTFDFVIDTATDFSRLEFTARPYNNDPAIVRADSSDFTLAQVSYVRSTGAPVQPTAPAGLVVTQSGGSTAVAEGGAGDSVTVALARQPSADVTVRVTGDADVGVGGGGAAVTLTFTPQNWNVAQGVAVVGLRDTLAEGSETARLTLDASSADPGYAALADTTVSVGVTEDGQVGQGPMGGPPSGAIIVKVGADIQALVNAAPTGAVFWIEAGEHRLQSITPKDGQHFIGAEGAILNGSRELSGFAQSGSTWFVGGQTQEGTRQATDQVASGFSRAGYPDAVFLDDKPLIHVGSLGEVKSGTFFFDYGADRIHIGDNPAGRSVEAAVKSFAFNGGATGVTVENLVVEKYAAPAQQAAIGGWRPPVDWVIENNEVRLNYGVGIKVGSGSDVRDNLIHDNGQMGVGAVGNGGLFEGNEIATNGFWSGISVYWEGGGSKFALTDGLVVRDNYVHGNKGMGLWTDVSNIRTLYEGNLVVNNTGAGISHEISYDAVIRNNRLIGNGEPGASWLWDAGIQIQNSSNTEVYGNFVDITDGANGIVLIQQNRGSGNHGPHLTTGNSVHDNIVTGAPGSQGRSGAVADWDWAGMKAGGNSFDRNEYRFDTAAEDHFAYNWFYGWDSYRAASGWDANSKFVLI